MRKRRTLVILLAVVLVIASLLTVFVACKPKPKPTQEEATMTTAIAAISSSIRNTYLYGGVPFGWDADINAAGYAIKSEGRIDTSSRDNTKMKFEISKDGEEVINISADDTYMYATQNDWKRRFNDFQFYQMMVDSSFPTQDENSEIMDFLQIGLTAIFSGETATFEITEDGGNKVYNLTGSLGSIVDMVKGILDREELNDVIALLAECDVTISAVISADNKLLSFTLDVITPIGDVNVGANKFVMGADCNPAVALPEGRDSFITTNALNFTLKGDVTLKEDVAFNKVNDVYKMSYTVRTDYNIFAAMRNSIKTVDGKMTFVPEGLFTDKSNKIYFDLYHNCDNGGNTCSYCKNNRNGASRGSMLTVAYAPEDFNNNNINVAINAKAMLPKGLINELIGDMGIEIETMFGEYLFVGIDPLAMMINEKNYKSITSTNETTNTASEFSNALASLDIKSMLDPNILGTLLTVFDFAKEIQYNDAEGVTLGTKQLANLIGLLDDSIGFNLSGVVGSFMTNSDYMNINVSEAQWGDESNLTRNFYDEFMMIDEKNPAYKEFGLNNSPMTAVKEVEWEKDKKGNVVIEEKSINNYDADGNTLAISEQEARTLFANGAAKYKYTTMNGGSGKAGVGIKAVYGLDYSSRVEQTVTVVTSMTDAGSLSALLSLVGGFVGGDMDLNFAGNYFTTKVLISDTVGDVELFQGDDVKSKYDAEKVYGFNGKGGTNINPYFTATVKYTDGSTKEAVLAPENLSDYFGNYGTPDNGYVTTAGDFVAEYHAFGKVFKMPFKVEKHTIAAVERNILVNQQVTTSQNYKFSDADGKQNTVYASRNNVLMIATVKEGNADNMTFTSNKNGSIEQGTFSFNKPGVYKVDLLIKGGAVVPYVFTVTDSTGSVVADVPGYDFSGSYVGKTITVKTSRTDNKGYGLNANFAVTALRENTPVVLVNGTDYKVYELINGVRGEVITGNFFLNRSYAAGGQTFEIVLTNAANAATTTKVAMRSADHDNTIMREHTITNAFDKYILTSSMGDKDAAEAYAIKYSAMCADEDAIAGLEIAIEIKVKLNGDEADWTTIAVDGYQIGCSYSMMPGWIPASYTAISTATFGFSADGKIDFNGRMDSYIMIAGLTANSKYQINVYATNYDNALIATSTNA